MPNTNFVRKEVKSKLTQYELISDCLGGEVSIKAKGLKYLPYPGIYENTPECNARYEEYKTRAVFYNVTQRTLYGLSGLIFEKSPTITLPTRLEWAKKDITGTGVGIEQFAKMVANCLIATGRCGIYVKFPKMDRALTIADIESGKFRPTFELHKSENIINWKDDSDYSSKRYSMINLKETYNSSDDEFEIKESTRNKVLILRDNVCYEELYINNVLQPNPSIITGNNGKPMDKIPFEFVGSDSNDANPAYPPLYDIASLNIAHYRNSADYEESCFIVGQITPYYTGLSEHWVEKVMRGKVAFGSRTGIPLPKDSEVGLLQAAPNSMTFEAMGHKEKLMTSLGARIVQDKAIQRTATEAKIESNSDMSILSTIAKNVSVAIENSLKNACEFLGADTSEVSFSLNNEFAISKLSFDEILKVIKMWTQEAITFTEMRKQLRDENIAFEDDKKAMSESENGKHEDDPNEDI